MHHHHMGRRSRFAAWADDTTPAPAEGRFGRGGQGRGGPGRFGPGGFGPGGFGPGGFGPGGFGPGGFRPGGFGPGPFGGFGPGGPGEGRRGPWRHGGSRRRRGDVRLAVLALLEEEPRHGYALMTALSERSGGLWRPSPGSVYPVLAQLEDEGLVTVLPEEGRRVFGLTDAGRAFVAEHREEIDALRTQAESAPAGRFRDLMAAAGLLAGAVQQVARGGDEAQTRQTLAVLEDARRALYRILAGDTVADEDDDLVSEPGRDSAGDEAVEG